MGRGEGETMDYYNFFGIGNSTEIDVNLIIRKLSDKVMCENLQGQDKHEICKFALGMSLKYK